MLALSTLLYCAVLLTQGIDNWGRRDWDQTMFRYETPRIAMLRDGELPLWNPYTNGGTSLLAHPHFPATSPLYLVVLLFGAPYGVRLQWLLCLTLGAIGTARLLRRLGASDAGQVLGGIVFAMSSQMAVRMAEGNVEWTHVALMPWLPLMLHKAQDDRRYVLYAGLVLAGILLFGSVYAIAIYVPFLSVVVALESLRHRNLRRMAGWVVSLVVAGLISAVKLLPQIELLMVQPPRVVPPHGVHPAGLFYMFVHPDQYGLFHGLRGMELPPNLRDDFLSVPADYAEAITKVLEPLGFSYGWNEYGAYITWLGLLLALYGMYASWRRLWPFYTAGLLAFFVLFGNRAPIDIWSLMRQLPLYRGLSVSTRFLAAFGFVLAVGAGLGLTRSATWIAKRWPVGGRWFPIVAPLAVFIELLVIGWQLQSDIFVIEPREVPHHESFAQRYPRRATDVMYPFVMHSSMVPYLASNSGYLDGYERVTVPRGIVARIGDPNYRGEVYLKNSPNPVKIHRWTMNSIEVEFDAKRPDLLIVNQNYFNGWKVREAGRTTKVIRTQDGLLGVDVEAGHHRFRVYYLPDSFLLGAIITACAMIGCAVFLIDERRRSTR